MHPNSRFSGYIHVLLVLLVMECFLTVGLCGYGITTRGWVTTQVRSAFATATSTVTYTPSPTPTFTPSVTPSPTHTPTPTQTPTSTATSTFAPIALTPAVLPAEVLLNVPNHAQERNLNCEFRSATDLAAYYGYTFGWGSLWEQVGYDPNGNPNRGFAGRSLDDTLGGVYPFGYGVHAEPIARGLQALGVPAVVYQDKDKEWLRTQLALGNPVMVWATSKLQSSSRRMWTTGDGQEVFGVPYEHTFVVVGYNDGAVWLNDPADGGTYYYAWSAFETSWNLFDNVAIVVEPS